MKIYDFPFAPNPRKFRIYVAEKGLSIQTGTVNLAKGEHRTAELFAKNPMGCLPVLEIDDGSYLTESLAIIEFLEELSGSADDRDPSLSRSLVRVKSRSVLEINPYLLGKDRIGGELTHSRDQKRRLQLTD